MTVVAMQNFRHARTLPEPPADATEATLAQFHAEAEHAIRLAFARPGLPESTVREVRDTLLAADPAPHGFQAQCARLRRLAMALRALATLADEDIEALRAPLAWQSAFERRWAVTGIAEQPPAELEQRRRAVMKSCRELAEVERLKDRAQAATVAAQQAADEALRRRVEEDQRITREAPKAVPGLLADLAKRGAWVRLDDSGRIRVSPAAFVTVEDRAAIIRFRTPLAEMLRDVVVI